MSAIARPVLLYVITSASRHGAQRYLYDLALYARARGHFDVRVAVGHPGDLVERLEAAGIQTYVLGMERGIDFLGDLGASLALAKLVRSIRPAVLHLNSSKIGFIGSAVGRLLAVPRVVFTAHGWPFEVAASWVSRVAYRGMMFSTVMASHATIAVSNQIRASWRSRRVLRKTAVIHNGIAPAPLLVRELARKRLGIEPDDGSVQVLSIGELHQRKAFDTAIRGISQLRRRDLSYHVIGEGPERPALERLVVELGLAGRVHLHGQVPDAASYLSAADVFVVPSRVEPFGYVALEAAAARVPVVASRVGGLPEIIEDQLSGILVEPDQPAALAAALESLLEMGADRRRQLCDQASRRLLEDFTFERMSEKTYANYFAP